MKTLKQVNKEIKTKQDELKEIVDAANAKIEKIKTDLIKLEGQKELIAELDKEVKTETK